MASKKDQIKYEKFMKRSKIHIRKKSLGIEEKVLKGHTERRSIRTREVIHQEQSFA